MFLYSRRVIQTRLYAIVAKLSSGARGTWMLCILDPVGAGNAHHARLSCFAAAGVQLRLAKVSLTHNPIYQCHCDR
jgi:hypothetical protein